MNKSHLEELKDKKEFVQSLSTILTQPNRSPMFGMDYEVFVDKDDDLVKEYLIVYHKGNDKFMVRNCTYNSCYAIFEEVYKLYNCNDYFDEIEDYEYIKENYISIFDNKGDISLC